MERVKAGNITHIADGCTPGAGKSRQRVKIEVI